MNTIDLANTIAQTLAKGDAVPGGMTFSYVNGELKIKLNLEDVDLKKIHVLDQRVVNAMELSFNSGPLVVRINMSKLKEA